MSEPFFFFLIIILAAQTAREVPDEPFNLPAPFFCYVLGVDISNKRGWAHDRKSFSDYHIVNFSFLIFNIWCLFFFLIRLLSILLCCWWDVLSK